MNALPDPRQRAAVIATVMESSPAAIDAAIDAALVAGADAVEVRLDAAAGVDPGAIGRQKTPRLIASCRPRRIGGLFDGPEDERVRILESAALTGRFRLDVEHGTEAMKIQRERPDCVAIVSHHDAEPAPAGLLLGRARELLMAARPGQIAKLVTTAAKVTDILPLRDVLSSVRDRRLALFAMGEAGRASRILCGAWGSAAVWAAAREERPGAPGQVDLASLIGLYRFRSLTRASRIYGVAGSAVSGSLSPAIHNAAFAWLSLDAVYLPLECADAKDLVRICAELPLEGISVTAPLKVSVLAHLAEQDEAVREVGACNTIIAASPSGNRVPLRGFNTDGPALLEEISSRLSPSGRPVLLAGAGGAARAAAFALRRAGARLTIANRGRERGQALARELGVPFVPLTEAQAVPGGIIVQATSAPLDDPVLPARAVRALLIIDMRYGERTSALVESGLREGIESLDGRGMLVRQAAAQVVLFAGREVPLERLFAAAVPGGPRHGSGGGPMPPRSGS